MRHFRDIAVFYYLLFAYNDTEAKKRKKQNTSNCLLSNSSARAHPLGADRGHKGPDARIHLARGSAREHQQAGIMHIPHAYVVVFGNELHAKLIHPKRKIPHIVRMLAQSTPPMRGTRVGVLGNPLQVVLKHMQRKRCVAQAKLGFELLDRHDVGHSEHQGEPFGLYTAVLWILT
jgi:hypothetical protein